METESYYYLKETFTVWKVPLFEMANNKGEHSLRNNFVEVCVRDEGKKY